MAKTGRGRASKQEVVEVYTEALAKQAEASIPDAKEEKKRADDIKLRDAAGTSSVETIVQNLASLRIGILKTLDGLGEQLVGEQKHLSQLTGAVELERQTLEELYGIKAEAGTLTALLSAQKEKQEASDADLAAKRTQLKLEQDQWEAARKENEAQLKKDREREREDYLYRVTFDRKKDEDAYKQRKESLEKDLAERKKLFDAEIEVREKAVVEQEKEMAQLRTAAAEFPEKLAKAVADAEKAMKKQTEDRSSFEAQLKAKEHEGEKRLLEHTVTTLQQKVKELEASNAALTQRMSDAENKVHIVALRALDTSSGAGRMMQQPVVDKPSDTTK